MDGNIAIDGQPRILLSSAGRGWKGLDAEFLRIPAGAHHVAGGPSLRVGLHFGAPVNADCRCDGRRHRRIQKHGDIDVVPAGLDGSWEDDADCSILRLRIGDVLLRQAADDLGLAHAAPQPRFQLRDAGIEAIAWAIKADLEAEAPSGRLYAESLGMALAARLLDIGRRASPTGRDGERVLSPMQRRRLVDFIEVNLDQPLSLADLAAVLGLGISQLKALFRNSFDMPVHQYVLRRRVERARTLLLSAKMPASQVALEAGFAHQSHMSAWMRRILGVTPGALARLRQ